MTLSRCVIDDVTYFILNLIIKKTTISADTWPLIPGEESLIPPL